MMQTSLSEQIGVKITVESEKLTKEEKYALEEFLGRLLYGVLENMPSIFSNTVPLGLIKDHE